MLSAGEGSGAKGEGRSRGLSSKAKGLESNPGPKSSGEEARDLVGEAGADREGD